MDLSDGIAHLLDHVGLRANTFYAGPLCGLHDFHADEGVGHLHVVRGGSISACQAGRAPLQIDEPALLFYPRPIDHRLDVPDRITADVLCASVRYDAGMDNAITQSFPDVIVIPFGAEAGLDPILALLFAESGEQRPGRQVMLDRLCDVLLIQIVRHVVRVGQIRQGILAGLAHPRLGNTLVSLLDAPGRDWTLEVMAEQACQSRNVFARSFKEVVGVAPAAFLTQIRIGVAQRLLAKGRPLTLVAEAVGYGSQPAFSRAFIRETGVAPSQWLRQRQSAESAPDQPSRKELRANRRHAGLIGRK